MYEDVDALLEKLTKLTGHDRLYAQQWVDYPDSACSALMHEQGYLLMAETADGQ